MSKMIQIRNVPDELHRKLKVRAAEASMTLSDYLLREIRTSASAPTLDEVLRRMESQPPLDVDVDIAELIRQDRESH